MRINGISINPISNKKVETIEHIKKTPQKNSKPCNRRY